MPTPVPNSIPLIDERQILPHTFDLLARLQHGDPPATGGWVEMEPRADWFDHPVGDVVLCHMRDVIWNPVTGIISDGTGRVVPSSLNAAGTRRVTGHVLQRGREMRVCKAALFLGFGAMRNYGHFLFDGLTGLAAMANCGLCAAYHPLAPRLSGWQREALALAHLPVREVSAARVRIDEVIFVTSMNHYLHRCNELLSPLVARMGGRGRGGEDVVYLSRRRYSGRVMLGEPELEASLAATGARILLPETLSVATQIGAMRRARVLIGASGAALANLIFLPKGATVIEIRPDPVREPWVDLACAAMGLQHVVISAQAPVPRPEVPWFALLRQLPRQLSGRYHYVARFDPETVVRALDELQGGGAQLKWRSRKLNSGKP